MGKAWSWFLLHLTNPGGKPKYLLESGLAEPKDVIGNHYHNIGKGPAAFDSTCNPILVV